MKLLFASLFSALALANTPVSGSKACVTNSAGFVLHWWYEDLNNQTESPYSDNYPIDQTKCMDIDIQNMHEGDYIIVNVHADLGLTKEADTPIIYDSTGPVLTYVCTGATLTFNCRLEGY